VLNETNPNVPRAGGNACVGVAAAALVGAGAPPVGVTWGATATTGNASIEPVTVTNDVATQAGCAASGKAICNHLPSSFLPTMTALVLAGI